MVKLRSMRWAEHVAIMGGKESIKIIDGKFRREETTRKTKT
jgi:hypothetical protein